MVEEEWRDIPKYEGLYQASNKGRIRSLPRKTTTGRVLSQSVHFETGYCYVGLSKNSKHTTRSVHTLVAEAFIGERLTLDVNHINGVKTDNNIENLEMVTRQQNIQHSHDNKLQVNARGADDSQSKLYKVTNPDGSEVMVKGLSEYCRVNNISRRGLYHVMHGNQDNFKGYKCEKLGE